MNAIAPTPEKTGVRMKWSGYEPNPSMISKNGAVRYLHAKFLAIACDLISPGHAPFLLERIGWTYRDRPTC